MTACISLYSPTSPMEFSEPDCLTPALTLGLMGLTFYLCLFSQPYCCAVQLRGCSRQLQSQNAYKRTKTKTKRPRLSSWIKISLIKETCLMGAGSPERDADKGRWVKKERAESASFPKRKRKWRESRRVWSLWRGTCFPPPPTSHPRLGCQNDTMTTSPVARLLGN